MHQAIVLSLVLAVFFRGLIGIPDCAFHKTRPARLEQSEGLTDSGRLYGLGHRFGIARRGTPPNLSDPDADLASSVHVEDLTNVFQATCLEPRRSPIKTDSPTGSERSAGFRAGLAIRMDAHCVGVLSHVGDGFEELREEFRLWPIPGVRSRVGFKQKFRERVFCPSVLDDRLEHVGVSRRIRNVRPELSVIRLVPNIVVFDRNLCGAWILSPKGATASVSPNEGAYEGDISRQGSATRGRYVPARRCPSWARPRDGDDPEVFMRRFPHPYVGCRPTVDTTLTFNKIPTKSSRVYSTPMRRRR